MPVFFFTEDITFSLKDKNHLIKWVEKVIGFEDCICGEVNIIFCDDKYLCKLNKKYLNQNTLTDVITFNFSNQKNKIAGDIFISIDTVKTNGKYYKVSFSDELCRVMVHGVLHLIGYNDKLSDEKDLMTEKEDHYLSLR